MKFWYICVFLFLFFVIHPKNQCMSVILSTFLYYIENSFIDILDTFDNIFRFYYYEGWSKIKFPIFITCEWYMSKYVHICKRMQMRHANPNECQKVVCLAFTQLRYVHICTRTQTRQAKAKHTRTYALIATRGKMLSFAEPVTDSLWSTDSRQIAFIRPQTEQRQFSSPRLHVYIATHASLRPASCTFLFLSGRGFWRTPSIANVFFFEVPTPNG